MLIAYTGGMVEPVQGRGDSFGQLLCEAGRDQDGEVHEPGGGLQLLHQWGAAGPRCRASLSGVLDFTNVQGHRSQMKIWIRNANRMQMQNVKVWTLSLMSVIDSCHYQGDHVSMVVILPPFLDDGLQVPTWYKFGNLVVNNLKRLLINLKIVHHLNDFRRLLI